MKKPIVRKLRCAVYTRKSTEEGLDMEFNSLDAQREACEAYVASQKAEALTRGSAATVSARDAKYWSYLAEMGVDDKWYHRMLRTASSSLDKLSFQESVEFFGWVPALAEWFTARCGTEIEAYRQQARRAAYKRLLNLE